MEHEVEFGEVIVIGGEFAGRFGLYDDDEENDAVVYLFGERNWIEIPHKHLWNITTSYPVWEATMGASLELASKTGELQ